MQTHSVCRRSHGPLSIPAMLAAVLTLLPLAGGCKQEETPTNKITPLPAANTPGGGPGSNPPPGQPNHMSPEMQAQIEHYKSLAPKDGQSR